MSVSRCLLLLAISLVGRLAASAQTLTVDELLQSPRQFEGRRVTVTGYYISDWEGHAIFADLASEKRSDMSRSLWIESAHANIESSLRKAQISGVFFYSRYFRPNTVFSGLGHMGMFPAALVNCTVHLQGPVIRAPNQTMQRTPTRRSRHISHD